MKFHKRLNMSKPNEPYLYMFHNDLDYAMTHLSGSALKLWLHFNKHHTKYVRNESRAEIMRCTGISRNSFKPALDELLEKGFLVLEEDIYHTALPNDYEIENYEI